MSKSQRTPRKPRTRNVPHEDLLSGIESVCARAGEAMRATAGVIIGTALSLDDEGGAVVFYDALEHLAGELESLSTRALKARMGGA